MRTLTAEQKSRLSAHIARKPIKYIELYNELYDHYASAYERGEQELDDILTILDQHFPHAKIERINSSLLSKTKKAVRNLYWEEFKNFWRWPQILSSLGILLLAFVSIKTLSMEFLLFIGLSPLLIFIFTISAKGYILQKSKKYGNEKFKSAHYKAAEYYQQLPIHIFNLCVLLPLIAIGPSSEKIHFYEQYPIIVFFLMVIFLSAAYIGRKVYRTKIKVQYL